MYPNRTCSLFSDPNTVVSFEKSALAKKIRSLPSVSDMHTAILSILIGYDELRSGPFAFFSHGAEGKKRSDQLRELIKTLPDSSEAYFIKLYNFCVEEKSHCLHSALCESLDNTLRRFLNLPVYSSQTRASASLGRKYDRGELESKIAQEDLKFATIADLIRGNIPCIAREVIELS